MYQNIDKFLSSLKGQLFFTILIVFVLTGIIAIFTSYPFRFYVGMMIGGLTFPLIVYLIRVVINKHKN